MDTSVTSSPPLASEASLTRDLIASVVVFLVALPLCLGIALASNAPLFSGLLAGIVGGILVGVLSGSHTSVSGPAAGLTAVVAGQIAALDSFQTFLLALTIAGVIQIGLGLARAGILAAFFPSSVIKGLLTAIGVILILKQIPHLFGYDADPEGDMTFVQPDQETTFSELYTMLWNLHPGAIVIGLTSVALLVFWDKCKPLKKSIVPAPLLVVLLGVGLTLIFRSLSDPWIIEGDHLVQVPVTESLQGLVGYLQLPDFTQWNNPKVYVAGLTIAIVASLETLLNLQAVDKIDPAQRSSPASRELLAQGCGNLLVGLVGGIPMTSVIVRSSVNINAGGTTKRSAIFHGLLLLACVVFLPTYLNLIPLSCLAAILLVTGFKLASPSQFKQMWNEGRYQFVPFMVTLVAIVLTDLLVGILIGLAVSVAFILNSNFRRPLRRIHERHLGGEVLHIELANQVSFLNRAALERTLREAPRGGHVLLDASRTDYIDPDILDLIRDFKEVIAPVHGVQLSLLGFRKTYRIQDEIQFVDYSTQELQEQLTPEQVLQILMEGNERYRSGHRLTHHLDRQRDLTEREHHPLAVVLSCVDSRAPVEFLFDLRLGDLISVRGLGNVTSPETLGSMEYGCLVAGARLILVLGHTHCDAIQSAVEHLCAVRTGSLPVGPYADSEHLRGFLQGIEPALTASDRQVIQNASEEEKKSLTEEIARRNVQFAVQQVVARSRSLREQVERKMLAVVGAMYDIGTGKIEVLNGR